MTYAPTWKFGDIVEMTFPSIPPSATISMALAPAPGNWFRPTWYVLVLADSSNLWEPGEIRTTSPDAAGQTVVVNALG